MPLVSVTRLRIRSVRFLPAFAVQTLRAIRQVRASRGFLGGSLLADRKWTFWTLTVWEKPDDMRAYMTAGAHRIAMLHLLDLCDEASVVHWETAETTVPTWPDADARMRADGRPSKVRHPSKDHAAMSFATPRISTGGPIQPKI